MARQTWCRSLCSAVGVATLLWYPSLPDKVYPPCPGVPTREPIAGGGPKREDYARINPAMFKNFSVIFRIVVRLDVLFEEW